MLSVKFGESQSKDCRFQQEVIDVKLQNLQYDFPNFHRKRSLLSTYHDVPE
jgi:hypothetical protein